MSKTGILLCFIAGAGFAAFVVGFATAFSADDGASGAYISIGVNVFWLSALLGYGLLGARAGRAEQRVLAGSEVRRTALAKIETAQATGEAPSFSVRMGLTIAPDGVPAFRSNALARVNLMDVDRYRAGRLLVVGYDETRPWRVTVLTDPDPEWARRLADGAVDSAPPETQVVEPKAAVAGRRRWGRVGTASMLAGFVAGLVYLIAHR
ncbi:MAG TPA: hypothetical protein VFN97_03095 [Actinospica sp.]|nr:hypothetical protein [Actinospica sp.]